jgi:predicted dehydrogenase
MTPLRWGILSTARINDALLGAGSADVVAIASRDADRAQAYAAQHGIPRAHGSYEALLEDPEVDVVYVSVPNALHVAWAMRALEAGKHVLCEKPISRRPEEVEALFDLAEERGLVLTEGFMWRHHPQVALVQQLIADGAIGRLRAIRADFAFNLLDATDPRLRAELGGGALMDVGCYCVSAARTLAGAEPVGAWAAQEVGGDGVDVVLAGLLRFPDGVIAHFDCALVGPDRNELVAFGDAGILRLPDPWHARRPAVELTDVDGRVERLAPDPVNSYALEIADVEAAVRGEHPPLLGRDDALGQARAIAALYAAAEAAGRR